jgi:hypothetical protein
MEFTLCQGYLLVIISAWPLIQTAFLNLKKISYWRITPSFVETYLLTRVTDWRFYIVIISWTYIPSIHFGNFLQARAESHKTVAQEMHRKYNLPGRDEKACETRLRLQ